jgi:hypothetical protein
LGGEGDGGIIFGGIEEAGGGSEGGGGEERGKFGGWKWERFGEFFEGSASGLEIFFEFGALVGRSLEGLEFKFGEARFGGGEVSGAFGVGGEGVGGVGGVGWRSRRSPGELGSGGAGGDAEEIGLGFFEVEGGEFQFGVEEGGGRVWRWRLGKFFFGLGEEEFGRGDFRLGGLDLGIEHPRGAIGLPRFGGEGDGVDV